MRPSISKKRKELFFLWFFVDRPRIKSMSWMSLENVCSIMRKNKCIRFWLTSTIKCKKSMKNQLSSGNHSRTVLKIWALLLPKKWTLCRITFLPFKEESYLTPIMPKESRRPITYFSWREWWLFFKIQQESKEWRQWGIISRTIKNSMIIKERLLSIMKIMSKIAIKISLCGGRDRLWPTLKVLKGWFILTVSFISTDSPMLLLPSRGFILLKSIRQWRNN